MEDDALKQNERYILLNAIDRLWQEHLYAMDSLREGIYLRSFGQKDPLVEYKNEAFEIFSRLMDGIRSEVLSNMFRSTAKLQEFEELLASLPQFLLSADESGEAQQTAPDGSTRAAQQDDSGQFAMPKPEVRAAPARRAVPKVGRNEPCPCGSGKKYKQCCGKEGAGGG
jgi:preprotein translocase subunit SecA